MMMFHGSYRQFFSVIEVFECACLDRVLLDESVFP